MRLVRLTVVPLVFLGALIGAPAASADLTTLKAACATKDALDDNTGNGNTLPFKFCDDGVPSAAGGTTPNLTAQAAVDVPSAYTGIAGLPATNTGEAVPGENPVTNTVALDADISLPDPAKFPATGNQYPVVVMMHGCCSGSKASWEGTTIDPGGAESWHYNNAWFASRGYIVVTYTSRGFVDSAGHGSTGETQLDSAKYEINDYQSLVGQLADAGDLDPGSGTVRVDPQRIVPTGGSYGGGFTWLALTDPTWNSPGASTPMKVAAAATKYGWTNLVESLVPRGDDLRDALPNTNATQVKNLLKAEPGFPKRTINLALYTSGKTGIPPGSAHTTFPAEIDEAQLCLTSTDPFETNPLCTNTLDATLGRFIDERSAYFQQPFFTGLANGSIDPVPVFSAGTFTDKLFPAPEHRRMVERLKAVTPGTYPVQEYYGDYNHFVQTKRKEFADVCGADHHVCVYADYPAGNLNAAPSNLSLEPGLTSRLNRFIDHYAKPPSNPGQATPSFDVTGALQVCPQNAAALGRETDEPGPRFTAGTFAGLAPNRLTVNVVGSQPTTNVASPNEHAVNSDPVGNLASNGGACPVEQSPGGLASAGAGVATYDSSALGSDYTMLGATRAVVQHTGAGAGLQLNARLYDLYPDGTQVMVDRGVKRLADAMGPTTMDLHGAGWKFAKGHRVRIELAQDDAPYIKSSTQPGSLVIAGVQLSIPVREGAPPVVGGRVPAKPGPTTKAKAKPRALRVRFAKVKGRTKIPVSSKGKLRIRCRATGARTRVCRVTVRQLRKGKKARAIGSGRATIRAGRNSAVVRLKLTRTGRRVLSRSLKRSRRGLLVRLDARVTERSTGRAGKYAKRYRLRHPAKRAKR